jgi:putative flavoprotein involved in K+ transport
VLVVGGGQAGLSISYYLKQAGVDHLVVEKNTLTHTWRNQRWDAFCLVTPNWQCALPGYPYPGDDPHGFMKKDEIIAYLDGFIAMVDAPVIEHTQVKRVKRLDDGTFAVATSQGDFTADQVVVASGGYHTPIVPRMAERLPARVLQLQSSEYRNPQALPEGAVMVVGSGQSGAQIAEDLHLAGRKVVLAVGEAPRCARFYRGRDVVDWLADMKYYDMPVEKHPLREGVRDNTNHYVTGRDGGRDIDLRKFAAEGMELCGRLATCATGGCTSRRTSPPISTMRTIPIIASTRASMASLKRTVLMHRPAVSMSLYGSRLTSVRRSNSQAAALHRLSGALALRRTSAG